MCVEAGGISGFGDLTQVAAFARLNIAALLGGVA